MNHCNTSWKYKLLIELCLGVSERCNPVPYVWNASVVQTNLSAGGYSVIQCLPGHRFPDGETQKAVKCLKLSMTTTFIEYRECAGTLFYQLMYELLIMHSSFHFCDVTVVFQTKKNVK